MVSIVNNILYSTICEETFPNDNMVKLMFKKFDQLPDREIIIDGDSGKSWTSKQLKSAISSVSISFLNDFNMVKGDVVCFQCHNCDLAVIGAIGAIASGGVFTACQSNGPYYELYRVVSLTNASFLVIDKVLLDNAIRVTQDCGYVKKIFIIGDEQVDESRNVYPFSILLNNPLSAMFIPITVDQDTICIILFSSGTTGLPKPVPKTHRNMLANLNCNLDSFDFVNDTDIVPVPWSLCYSSQMKLMTMSLFTAAKMVIFEDTDMEKFCSYFHRYKFTKAILVPSYIIKMVQLDLVSKYDLSSLKDVLVTGSILAESMGIAFIKKFNTKYVRQLYGATEVSTCVMQRKADSSHQNVCCAGIPPPGYSVKIADPETGVPLDSNCVGELCTKGPTVMSGFLNMPQENLEAFDEHGYYKTGDAAYYDAAGRIYIVDRYKNILKNEGTAISCAELESIIIKHERIKEVCVIGIKHEIYGEVPRAFVVVDHGQLSSKDVTDLVSSHLCNFKQLDGGVVFLNSIPRNNFGKINHKALLEISCEDRLENMIKN